MKSNVTLRANHAAHWKQRGYAALITVIILALAALTFLVRTLQDSAANVNRAKVSEKALGQAKAALIGWAAQATRGPGHLVCPDTWASTDPRSGTSPGAICSVNVGRLPWKTLDIPDLRDGSGERLWYAVSDNFVNKGGNPVNSDTQGQLTLNGDSVIAIVFAPGLPTNGQSRVAANFLNAAHYLEGANSDATANAFEMRPPDPNFNDVVAVIRARDLWPVVENAVAIRLQTEIAPMLRYYRDHWKADGTNGFFPFASAYTNNAHVQGESQLSECPFIGSQRYGSIPPIDLNQPITPGAPVQDCATWDSSLLTSTISSGTAACTDVTAAVTNSIAAARCTYTYSGAPEITIDTGPIRKAATSLVTLEPTIEVGTPPTSNDWIPEDFFAILNVSNRADLSARYKGKLPPSALPTTASITIPLYRVRDRISFNVDWFFFNGWHRHTRYAITEASAPPGSGAACSVNCFTVAGFNGVTNDKEVVLILAGEPLPAFVAPRNGSNMSQYWEPPNDDSNLSFKMDRLQNTFNDRLIVVEP